MCLQEELVGVTEAPLKEGRGNGGLAGTAHKGEEGREDVVKRLEHSRAETEPWKERG